MIHIPASLGFFFCDDHLYSALQALQAWAQEVHVAPKYAAAEDFQHHPGQGAERQGMGGGAPVR